MTWSKWYKSTAIVLESHQLAGSNILLIKFPFASNANVQVVLLMGMTYFLSLVPYMVL